MQSNSNLAFITKLKIALVHYHLRAGGVTKVISNQCRALVALGYEPLIFSAGSTPSEFPPITQIEVPLLDYLSSPPDQPVNLYQTLLLHCEKHWGTAPDLWHLHNHSLGKNILFPQLVRDLAESQIPLILQPHDFAEDNRPTNYPLLVGEKIHPTAPQIHYAFINNRDRTFLETVGLKKEESHHLPNTVSPPPVSPNITSLNDENLVLYPVRGIRRKNLGEAVLLAALAPSNTRFAISLAPENPIWHKVHQDWEAFAREHQLPIEFAVTDQVPPYPNAEANYQTWLKAATHLLTTSIAEGFGLTFLEPIALQKPLLGRDLPEITQDFREQGINPGRFYEKIPIPLEFLDLNLLRNDFEHQVQNSYHLYQKELRAKELEAGWQALIAGGEVDFGALPETFQQDLITRSLAQERAPFASLRKWLAHSLSEALPTATPDSLSQYSPSQAQQDLSQLYANATSSPREAPSWLSKDKVLAQYLSPSRFHFLRS